MQPPPGSVPHPIGQGLVVAVPARASRARLLLAAGSVLALLYVAMAALLLWASPSTPRVVLALLLLLVPLAVLQLLLVLGQAAVVRGALLVVDDAGIRTRDLVGWVQVPWSSLQGLSLSRDGRSLQLEAPGGVYLNERLTRRPRHRVGVTALAVRPEHLLSYLQHRWTLAQHTGSTAAPPRTP